MFYTVTVTACCCSINHKIRSNLFLSALSFALSFFLCLLITFSLMLQYSSLSLFSLPFSFQVFLFPLNFFLLVHLSHSFSLLLFLSFSFYLFLSLSFFKPFSFFLPIFLSPFPTYFLLSSFLLQIIFLHLSLFYFLVPSFFNFFLGLSFSLLISLPFSPDLSSILLLSHALSLSSSCSFFLVLLFFLLISWFISLPVSFFFLHSISFVPPSQSLIVLCFLSLIIFLFLVTFLLHL